MLERSRPSETRSSPLTVASVVGPEVVAVAEVAEAAGMTESAAAGLGTRAQAAVGPEKRETEALEALGEVAAAVVAGRQDIR